MKVGHRNGLCTRVLIYNSAFLNAALHATGVYSTTLGYTCEQEYVDYIFHLKKHNLFAVYIAYNWQIGLLYEALHYTLRFETTCLYR